MTSDQVRGQPDDAGEFLVLDQAPAEGEQTSKGRPWAKCTCGHRIWSERALRLGKGSKCARGLHLPRRDRGHGGRIRGWRDVTGQADLFAAAPSEDQPQEDEEPGQAE
ncbi:hypothetical protein ACFOY2_46225 [Nonomuraea purpurea]|uniref:Uncharacterized protein n=1 Tax=Nonomuraea purpurea TaxID=1849276 RepID=A0ABV8GL67_9ACTN